jgi:hypothetical protein
MRQKKLYSQMAMLIMVTGCQPPAANSDLPALIVQPDEDSRAALQATLSGLFGGYEVRLSNDALTRTSLLTLESGLPKTLGDPPVTGRVLSESYKFRLIKNGDYCTLIDLRDGTRHILADTRCILE